MLLALILLDALLPYSTRVRFQATDKKTVMAAPKKSIYRCDLQLARLVISDAGIGIGRGQFRQFQPGAHLQEPGQDDSPM
jgi:hypothetical protein